MPKKTRKMKQRAALRKGVAGTPLPEREVVENGASAREIVSPARVLSTPSARAATPLTFDYSHIYGDLKRIALFAGFFFAVLIVLSFIIK
ncbi:MAG: hypothetical protein N2559_12890 [Anaerolineae bacterium]|nr:hypothetical protein [Anaerolineae bacterium]